MELPTIPVELISSIASNVIDLEADQLRDRSKFVPRLRTLALVSRAWLLTCRKRLFSQYTLGPIVDEFGGVMDNDPLQLPRFLFLLKRPRLAAYVTELRIRESDTIPFIDAFTYLVHDVLPNVISLSFDDSYTLSGDVGLDTRLVLSIGSVNNLRRLRYLEFQYGYKHIYFEQIDFLKVHLHSLSLSTICEDMLSIFKSLSSSPTANSLQKTEICLIYFDGSDTRLSDIHRALTNFVNCTEFKLDYGKVDQSRSQGMCDFL
jgi:hypothetical protein